MAEPLEQWETWRLRNAPHQMKEAGDALAEAYRALQMTSTFRERTERAKFDNERTLRKRDQERLAKAEAENERLRDERDTAVEAMHKTAEEAAKVVNSNERLRAALEWYARKAVWVQTNTGGGHHNASLADLDRGKRAREALANGGTNE